MTSIPLEFPQARGSETEEPRRFCKDCRWAAHFGYTDRTWECTAPQNMVSTTSLVTGEPEISWRYADCRTQRTAGPFGKGAGDNCSVIGRWFEPRESEQSEAAQ